MRFLTQTLLEPVSIFLSSIETLTISKPSETSFSVLLNGSITNAGPCESFF